MIHNKNKSNYLKQFIETLIFQSKWFLLPFYLILILALISYTYFNIKEFAEYISEFKELNKDAAMLTFVELIDMAMIANLGRMIISSSYNSFISKDHNFQGENISSGMMKVKMATSLVGITSIGLLQKTVDITKCDWDLLYKLSFVHVVFLGSALVLELVEYLHHKGEKSSH